MAQEQAGSVVSLWRYPVKSMVGEELNASAVTARGLLGDRAYALVDRSHGKVASAKSPRNGPGCSISGPPTSTRSNAACGCPPSGPPCPTGQRSRASKPTSIRCCRASCTER
ncbi:MOSC N-terminal beta barrel domain-containing protein [Geodermatophilus sp. CPCC 205506]|uniref:MOSC N-terminal beta barrel domain-containing protein n=1 Tax=Geodermatophilus sp. CPCC 205506 TaxID=2936596 RepID=UPI003F52D1AA